MITKDQIRNITGFNLSSLQEGLRQAEQRLGDSLIKKENLDKKAFILLFMFLFSSTALFCLPKILNIQEPVIFWSSILSGLCFLIGVILLFLSLKALDYGTMGRYPDTWLQEGILNGDDDMKAYVLANVLYDYQKSIEISDQSNSKKIKLVDTAIILGISAPILFLICLGMPYLI